MEICCPPLQTMVPGQPLHSDDAWLISSRHGAVSLVHFLNAWSWLLATHSGGLTDLGTIPRYPHSSFHPSMSPCNHPASCHASIRPAFCHMVDTLVLASCLNIFPLCCFSLSTMFSWHSTVCSMVSRCCSQQLGSLFRDATCCCQREGGGCLKHLISLDDSETTG